MNREALDRILKKMENVPQAKQSYAVRDEDGNNIGNVTYWGKKAIESNRLDSYTPQNEEEAQTLSIYQKYLEQIQSTPKSSNSVLDKYGIDPDNFSYADFQKWAVSHNFEPAKTQGIPRLDKETGKPSDVYGPGTYWFPKRTWAFGKKLTSEEDEQALAQLRALAEKNERKSAMSQKSSPVVTAVEGFADAITFGLSDALNDRKDQKLVSQLGEEYISRQDAKKKNAQEHPAANIVGAVSGSLIPFSGISGAVSTATKGIKWFSKMPRWVQSAFNSGITFSIIGGAETAVSGGEPKDIIKSAGINLLGGSAGGAAGSVVGKIGEKFLFNKQLQHKVIPEIIRNGLSASAFSGAKTASTYWLYPEESRPEKEDIAKDILSAFAIASISSYVDVLSASKQSKKTLNDLNQKMAADYEQMARESVSGEKGTQGSRKFAKNVLEYNKQIEAFLTGKGYEGTVDGKRYSFEPNKIRLVGQNKQVSQILENLQTIQNRANAVLNGMPSAGTDIAVRSEAAVSAATPAETSVVPAVSTGAAVKAAEAVRTQVQSVNRQGNTQISAVPVQSVQNDGQVQNNAAITPKRQNIQEPSPTINRAEPNEDSHIEFSPQEKTALAKGLSSKRAKGVTLEQAEADIRAVTAKAKQQIERLVNPDGAVTADGAKLRRANTEFLSRPDALIDESFIRLYAETFADALDQSGNRIFKAAKQQNGDIAADIAGYAMTGTLRGTYDQQTGSAVKIYGKDFRKALQSAGQAAYSAKIRLYQETPVMSGQISALQDGKLRRVVQLSAAQRDGALYYQRYLDGDTEEIHGITAVEGKGGAVVAFGENASRLADLTGTEPVTMVFGDEAVSMVRVDKAELIGQADGEASADNGGEPANVSALSIESMSQNEESISHSKRGSDGINRGKLAVSTDRAAQMLKNISEARKQFVEFAKQRFPNVVVNEQTQKEIGISRTGVDKFLSGNISKEKLATGFEIPELLRTATKTGEAPNKKGKTGISGYEYYYNTIQVDGQEYAAYIRVRNTDMGDKYYGHTIGKSLVDIKLEPLAWNSEEKTPVHSINASSSITNSIPQNAATVNPSIRGNGENDTVKKAKTEGVEKAGGNDIIKSSVNETDYGYALSGIPSRTEMERISREAANDGAVVELSGDDGMAGATLVYDDSATPETVRRDILAYYQDGVMPKNAIPDDAAFDDVRFSVERGSDYYKEDENGRKNEEQWEAEAIRRDDAGGEEEGFSPEDKRYGQEQSDARTSGRDYTATEAGISRQISKLLNKPLYHGTGADIAVFSPSYMDIGIHFGTREQAEARVSGIERPRMIQAGLEIKNPLYVREDIFGERSPKEYLEDLLEYAELTGEQKRALRARFDVLEQSDLEAMAWDSLNQKIQDGTHDVTWTYEPDGIYVELSIKDRNGRLHNIPRVEMLERAQIISVLSDSDVIALLNGDSLSAQGNEAIQDLAIDQLTHIEADYLRLRNLEESIQELGYDGLVYPNQNEGEGLSFAVFRDSQIKRTDDVKFSIEYTADNTPAVIIDKKILDGVPKSKWVSETKKALAELSDGIPVDGRLIKVNKITRNEYVASKYSKNLKQYDNVKYADKLNSAGNAGEIVLASTNYINEDLKHTRKDNFVQFARGDILLQIGGRQYDAKVIIGFTSGNEMVLYDLVDMKSTDFKLKKSAKSDGQSAKQKPIRTDLTDIDTTISQDTEEVNSSIRGNGGNDTRLSSEGGKQNESGGDDLLSGDMGRRAGTGAGEQAGRISETAEASETAGPAGQDARSARRVYGEAVRADGGTETRRQGRLRCEFVKPEFYTEEMRGIERENMERGLTTHFFVGDGRMAFRPDIAFRGAVTGDEIYIRADHGKYSPSQINRHELVHRNYNTEAAAQAREQIGGRLPAEEKQKIINTLYARYNALTGGDAEAVFEEFVCDVLAGMNEYASQFAETAEAYWNAENSEAQGYDAGTYAQSIDAGGTSAAETERQFSGQIDRWKKGEMGPSETFGLGETPEVLQRIGAENLPIVMTQAVMEKITGGKHDIGLDELKKLPRNLADPLMVFESSTVKGAYVILTEMTDKSGAAVVAALHIKRTENHHTVNRVASVYGKEGIERFIHTETKKGHLRYIDKNKSQQWSQSRGLRLPKLADTITDKNNILQKEDIVNSSIRETGGNDTRYSLENTAEADTDYLSEPAERIRNDVEAVRLRAEARKGKTYTQDEIRQVCVSILDNIDAGTGRGLSMTRKDKAAMMILANRALHAGGDAAAEPHIRRLAAFTAQKALVQDASEYFDYKRTLSHLRDTARHSISLTEADKQTLDGMLGEAAAGYKAFYGGGTRGVNAVYDELSEARPDLYPANLTTESAKLQKITEVHQWLREGAETKNERLLDILKEDDRAAFAELVRDQISGAMREAGRPSRLSAELQAAEARRQQDLARMRERYEKKISNMREKVRSREKARLAARSIEPLEYIRPESLTAAAEEYGRMKQGETPARDIAAPKKISKKQYVSRMARTMLEAGVTPAEAVSEFEKRILDGTMTYERVTDKSAKAWVDRYLRGRSFSEALKYWNNLIDAGGRVDKNHMALGMALYNQCVNAKDAQNAMKIAADLARTATQAGQTVQAVRILKQMSPDAQLYDLEQSVDKINADLKKRLGKKYREIEIDEKLAQEYLTAESEEQRDEVMERITAQVAAQIPATVRDKLDAWRYLSMLANPRTHIRNIVGNAVFVPAVELKNAIGAAMEKAIPKGQRTKAVTRAAGTVEFASKDFKNIEKAAAGNSSRFNEMAEGIENQRTIFKTKPLEKLRKLNFDLLELEDVIFLKRAYVSSLSGAMTARGYTPEFLSSGTLEANQTLEKLRDYAILEAQRATYRDANALAKFITQTQRKARNSKNVAVKTGGLLFEGLLPFKTTPLNILRRGLEYSPVGLVKGGAEILQGIRSGDWTPAQAIDDLAKGFSGSILVALGALLCYLGLVQGAGDDNDKVSRWEEAQGYQDYALKLGDSTYTIDWMAPSSLPLFVGAELMKMLDSGNGIELSSVLDALTKISDPMMELSVLQGVSSAIKTAGYSEQNALSAVVTDMVVSYFGQYVPTFLGQVARTVDKTRRSAYIEPDSNLPRTIDNFVQRMEAKLPFVSYRLQPRLDAWGREQTNGDTAAGRVLANFVSPGYYKEINSTRVDQELKRLYDLTGDTDVLPRSPQKKLTVDGKEYHLTGSQYTDYAVTRGQYALREVEALISGKREIKARKTDTRGTLYRSATDEERVKAIRKIYDEAHEYAKGEINRKYGLWEDKKKRSAGYQ